MQKPEHDASPWVVALYFNTLSVPVCINSFQFLLWTKHKFLTLNFISAIKNFSVPQHRKGAHLDLFWGAMHKWTHEILSTCLKTWLPPISHLTPNGITSENMAISPHKPLIHKHLSTTQKQIFEQLWVWNSIPQCLKWPSKISHYKNQHWHQPLLLHYLLHNSLSFLDLLPLLHGWKVIEVHHLHKGVGPAICLAADLNSSLRFHS